MKTSRFAIRCAAALLFTLPSAAYACDSEPYVGSICTFAFSWCPSGYVPADGRTLSIQQYQALFGVLAFTYGGDNRTTFGVPDLRGRFAVGQGVGAGLTPVGMAEKVGQQAVTLSPAQTPLPAHTHVAAFTPTTSNTQVTIPATTGNLNVTASLPVSPSNGSNPSLGAGQQGYLAGVDAVAGLDPVTVSGPYTTSAPGSNAASLQAKVSVTGTASTAATQVQVPSVTGGAVTIATTAAAATAPVSTQSPAIGMSVCIAVSGLYPNRP